MAQSQFPPLALPPHSIRRFCVLPQRVRIPLLFATGQKWSSNPAIGPLNEAFSDAGYKGRGKSSFVTSVAMQRNMAASAGKVAHKFEYFFANNCIIEESLGIFWLNVDAMKFVFCYEKHFSKKLQFTMWTEPQFKWGFVHDTVPFISVSHFRNVEIIIQQWMPRTFLVLSYQSRAGLRAWVAMVTHGNAMVTYGKVLSHFLV